jgi:hypothetical protein
MKKIGVLFCLPIFLICCSTRSDTVETTLEEGVEVVLNHIRPYRLKGAPEALHLEEELTIDTEREDLAKQGVTDIWGFDVNSLGEIFIFQPPMSSGDLVYKFDAKGRFLYSFVPKGQGPGEVQWPIFHRISAADELPVLDMISRKLFLFDHNGKILQETPVPLEIRGSSMVLQLSNGNYLYRRVELDPRQKYPSLILTYCLVSPEFQNIKELDRVEIPHPLSALKIRFPFPLTVWGLARDRICIGNEQKGYEICVYDQDGNLVRKIRKEYAAIPFPENKKRAVLKLLESPQLSSIREKLEFAEFSPPFQHLFCDDEGRLYVMTYETGESPGEYLFDIFTSEGVSFARTSCAVHLSADLTAPGSPTDSWVTAKNGRFYAIREKSNGYKELVGYRMIWEAEYSQFP